jgi:tetratricopeptide (TPR) repeat protein
MGVLVGKRILLLDPKLGLPILDPDNDAWTTVQDATTNARILRRLSLPQYAYPFDSSSILNVQILIDAVPFAASQRAALLQASLLGEERMTVAVDLQSLADRLGKEAPNAVVSLWHVPLLAQLYAEDKREKLSQITEYTMRYMAEHAIWLLDNPVSTGRILHLGGQFENSLEQTGALKTYINARVDDESLRRLAYNPDVQKAMGLFRSDQETKEQFDARVRQVQFLFGRSKFDVAFLLAQLHYDRGDYESTVYWLKERVLSDPRAAQWHAAGWYLLGRALTQLEKYDEAQEALTLPAAEQAGSQPGYAVNPQDAGNRLRLRYLRKLIAPEQADLAQVANVTIP